MVSNFLSLLLFAACLVSAPAQSTPLSQEPVPASPPSSLQQRADSHMARREFREAAELYEEAYQQEADKVPILLNKIGIAYHQMMEFDVARKYYERAIEAKPGYAEAINNLGTIYYAKRDYGRAVDQYRKALKVNPKSASILSNLGTAYFAQKRYKEAFESYQEALAIDPEVFEHRSTQGVLLQERSVEERAMFHFYLAKTYAKAGMFDRALLYIRRALEEGFKDRQRLREDAEFAAMQELPEFQELLALEPRVL